MSNDTPADSPVWPVPTEPSASAPIQDRGVPAAMPDAPSAQADAPTPARPVRPVGTAPSTGSAGQRTWTIFSQTRWDGSWEVPERMVVSVAFGEVVLDLREAHFTSWETEIEVLGLMGEVKIVVPHTHRVQCRGSAILGEFRAKEPGSPAPAAPDAPVVWVTGSMALGEVTVFRTDAAVGEGAFGIDGFKGWRARRLTRRAH